MATKTTKSNVKKAEQKMVMVIIPKPNGIIGDTETTVSVNGQMYQIMYDKPVTVPENVAEVINNSNKLQAKILEETNAALLRPGKESLAEL
jgi:hypothetical protein